MLKQINHYVLALIPKSKAADKVEDFRPIACCNVMYKVISKIIASRLAPTLCRIIDPAQAAFVQNRSMIENIFLLEIGQLKDNADFNFHPKCGGLKITHLAFADDLVILSRGDPRSVSLLMENLSHFGECSGLKVSFSKSNLFVACINSDDLASLKEISGFSQGSFPF
ncbi:hypothetical protein Acr_00g0041690 [Actinidia rufa]|uniref:Reverse transcriptase domain-containing protein n=1 Tax=Actinidia rufa TaxID=165716 RepID=A0A7J0DI24_9ERIC|nr:hypothetical protein Acr_00g0041690 [Actinidia rufa]